MATGYTADVQSGKVTDFRTFALRCARAFGALISMRDDPIYAVIPEKFEPSDFYSKNLAEAKERLATLHAMTLEQAQAEATKEFEKHMSEAREYETKMSEQRSRYEAMLSKVDAWMPPTNEHRGLKDFMQKQLNESIDFDCSGSYWNTPKLLSGEEWLRAKIDEEEKNVTYYITKATEECERAAGRTEWVQALMKSLS